MKRLAVAVACAVLLLAGGVARAAGDEALWALLQGGGQVVMIRHGATEAQVGDPPGFKPGDCATQRNLNDAGREQARRLGAAFRARSIPVGRVLSSEWCRCLDTARLAFGSAEPWAALNSYFRGINTEEKSTAVVMARASAVPAGGNLILVTHNFNIRSVTGVNTAPTEMVILTPDGRGGFTVAGSIGPDR